MTLHKSSKVVHLPRTLTSPTNNNGGGKTSNSTLRNLNMSREVSVSGSEQLLAPE